MLGQAVPDLGRAPHHDLEHLLILEQAADLDARQQRGRRPADVARLDAIALGAAGRPRSPRGSSTGSSTCGRRRRRLRRGLPDLLAWRRRTRGPGRRRARRGPALGAVGASGSQRPALRIGQHVSVEAGVAVDHVLDRSHGLVVVGRRIEADPQLAGVDVDDLIATSSARPTMGADVADAGDRRSSRWPAPVIRFISGQRRAGRAIPVDQEVALLERRQQRLVGAAAPRGRPRPAGRRDDHGRRGCGRRVRRAAS